MPTEKLRLLLQSKSPFSKEEIAKMTDGDGWRWVYSHKEPARTKKAEVYFTGFGNSEKKSLSELARSAGFTIVTTVTLHLLLLCVGADPGQRSWTKHSSEIFPLLIQRSSTLPGNRRNTEDSDSGLKE